MSPDYKREFQKERQRLAQLWDAYEQQGAEMERMQRHLQQLEIALHEKDQRISALNQVVGTRSSGELQRDIRTAESRQSVQEMEEKVALLEENLRFQQERTTELFNMAEDLDKELVRTRAEVEERDRLIAQLKTMLDSKDKELERLRYR